MRPSRLWFAVMLAGAAVVLAAAALMVRSRSGGENAQQRAAVAASETAAGAGRGFVSGLTRTVLPLEAGLDDIPGLPVTPEQAQLLRHGQQLFGIPANPGLLLARDGDVPVALVESDGATIKVVRGFNLCNE